MQERLLLMEPCILHLIASSTIIELNIYSIPISVENNPDGGVATEAQTNNPGYWSMSAPHHINVDYMNAESPFQEHSNAYPSMHSYYRYIHYTL